MCSRAAASCAPAARSLRSSSRPRAMRATRTRQREAAMTAEVRLIKTDAETALAEAFAAAKSRLPGGREVAARREAAFRRFEAGGPPDRRVAGGEENDLRPPAGGGEPPARP